MFDVASLPHDVTTVVYASMEDDDLMHLMRTAHLQHDMRTLVLTEDEVLARIRRVASSEVPVYDCPYLDDDELRAKTPEGLLLRSLTLTGPRFVTALRRGDMLDEYTSTIMGYCHDRCRIGGDVLTADVLDAMFAHDPSLVQKWWGECVTGVLEAMVVELGYVRDDDDFLPDIIRDDGVYFLRRLAKHRGDQTLDVFREHYDGDASPAEHFWDIWPDNVSSYPLLYEHCAARGRIIPAFVELGMDLDTVVKDKHGREFTRLGYMLWHVAESYSIGFLTHAGPLVRLTDRVLQDVQDVLCKWRRTDFTKFQETLQATYDYYADDVQPPRHAIIHEALAHGQLSQAFLVFTSVLDRVKDPSVMTTMLYRTLCNRECIQTFAVEGMALMQYQKDMYDYLKAAMDDVMSDSDSDFDHPLIDHPEPDIIDMEAQMLDSLFRPFFRDVEYYVRHGADLNAVVDGTTIHEVLKLDTVEGVGCPMYTRVVRLIIDKTENK